jgi:hypothetical protein
VEDVEAVAAALEALVVMCETTRRLQPQRDLGPVVRLVLVHAIAVLDRAALSSSIPESVRTELEFSRAAMPAGAALGLISDVRVALPATRRRARA